MKKKFYLNKIFIFIIFISIFSIIVSSEKSETFFSCLKLLTLAMYSVEIVDFYQVNSIIKNLLISQVIICILVLVFQFTNFNNAIEFYEGKVVWNSSFYSKNSLAIEMALGCIISYLYFFRIRKGLFSIIVFITSGFILIKTGSATSILIVLVSILIEKIIFFIEEKYKVNINIVNFMYILNVIFYLFIFFFNKYNNIFEKIFNRDLTLTGRTYIWEGVLKTIPYNLLFGTGYETFWGYNEVLEQNIMQYYYPILHKRIIGAHNGFLDLILQIGIIGTIFFLYVLWSYGKKANFLKNNISKTFFYMYIVYLLMFFITERSLGSSSYQTFLLFISLEIVQNEFGKRRKNE
ncbi:O-antigen ligase family protein [Clostridium perfringens]